MKTKLLDKMIISKFISITLTIGITILILNSFFASAQNLNEVDNKSDWYKNAYDAIKNKRYPRIVSESIWSESWENGEFVPDSDLQINSSDDALNTYKSEISDDIFITEPNWILRNITQIENNDTYKYYKLNVPENGIYHNAYPDFTDSEDQVTRKAIQSFIDLSGKDLMYVYFSNHWLDNISFPYDEVELIHDMGMVPYIRMMPWSNIQQYVKEPVYTLQNIIDGKFDDKLTQWAIDANDVGFPIIAEFGVEVNGPWFPWNGKWNGGGTTDGYGDPNIPDGPERFQDAYRHIIDLFRENNAYNITWVFHVDSNIYNEDEWNSMDAYYPGDDYIDWIGISAYGPQTYEEDWFSFTDVMDQAYPELCNISTNKPLALLEFGVDENAGTKNIVTIKLYVLPPTLILLIIIYIFVKIKKRHK